VSEVVPVLAFGTVYTFTVTHTYTSAGAKTISVSMTDDEGATGTGSTSLAVRAALAPDGTLSVAGSSDGDNFIITRVDGNLVRVQSDLLEEPVDFPAAAVSAIVADLGDGNDFLLIAATLTQPAVVLGGAGNDILIGGGGRDILIGGTGTDVIHGRSNQDILVGGATIHDANVTALLALLAEWNSEHSLLDRVLNLKNGSGSVAGLNGSYFLTLVGNDNAVDFLVGGSGTDWIWYHIGDVVVSPGDLLNLV